MALLLCATAHAAGTWSAAGSLNTARYAHTATLLPSGEVLFAGGSNGSNCIASAELYDPFANTWIAAATRGERLWGDSHA